MHPHKMKNYESTKNFFAQIEDNLNIGMVYIHRM